MKEARQTAICALLVLAFGATPAVAQRYDDRRNDRDDQRWSDRRNDRGEQSWGERRDDRRDDRWRQEQRRDYYRSWDYRSGVGMDHRFHRGDRLPREYRTHHYVVNDWRGHHLTPPPRGYQWVQSGGDYLLVAIATGIIVNALLNN